MQQRGISSNFMRSPRLSSRTIVSSLADIEQLRQAVHHLVKMADFQAVDRPIELQGFARGQIPPNAFFCPMSRENFRFSASSRRHGICPRTRAVRSLDEASR
jgi:hypothetical protein